MAVIIDLTHSIPHGLVTDSRLPAVKVAEFWSRAASAKNYAPEVSFQIASVEFAQNTGTYIDCPWHRYEDGLGVWNFPLERFVDLPTVVADVRNKIDSSGKIDEKAVTSAAMSGRALCSLPAGRNTGGPPNTAAVGTRGSVAIPPRCS